MSFHAKQQSQRPSCAQLALLGLKEHLLHGLRLPCSPRGWMSPRISPCRNRL